MYMVARSSWVRPRRTSDHAKIIGCEINSSQRARSSGLITAGAPVDKRLAMACITLSLCALDSTTDSLHLCLMGGWISILLYRRPLMCIFCSAYGLVDAGKVDPARPKVIPLPRRTADELVLVSVLSPVLASNFGAPWSDHMYATDASNSGDAYVKAHSLAGHAPPLRTYALPYGLDPKNPQTCLVCGPSSSWTRLGG